MGSVRLLLTLLTTVLTFNTAPLPALPADAPSGEAVSAVLSETNGWSDGKAGFTQYEVTVQNRSAGAVSDWTLDLNATSGLTVSQCWNCTLEKSGDRLVLTPADYARTIPAGGQTQGIGLIVSGGKLSVQGVRATLPGDTAPVPSSPSQPGQPQAPAAPVTVPDGAAGKLHVSGTGLADETGKPVQLRGVSTHGMAWFPQFVNASTFQTLRDDWGANTIRLAMYTAEYGGYCNGGDREALKALVDKGVQAASGLGMYVMIDWHILSDGDPRTHQDDAVTFFSEMSAKYKNYPNVIYEICNEPNGAPWETAIKPYAQQVLAAIRKNAPDAVVVVGTNTWSQDVDAVAGKELDDPNVVYAFHFYSATHKDELRRKLTRALDAGVPVLVSECGISEASGQGVVDTQSANAWLELLNQRGVSFMAWGLSNKAETVSLLKPGCEKVSGWTEADLSESGLWFRNAIRSR